MVRGLLYRRKRAARKYRFHPPRHVAPCMTFARWLAPRYSRWVLGVTRVTVSPADAARLRQLRRERVVLTPNHPTQDPAVLFHFSTMLGMQFYWLAAREVFETTFQGWLVSRVGAYSVDRGTRDSDAVHMTRQLLTEGRHWLVLFPEGVNHFLHDVVMPFLPGAARIGLGALDDLAARGGELPPLYTVPLALRYHYTADMRPKMDAALRRLERKLRLDGAGGNDWHGRMDAIADRILDANEEFFGVMPQPDESLPQRLGRLREVVLSRVAAGLGLELPPPDKPLRNRVRRLLNETSRILQEQPRGGSDYRRELQERRRRRAEQLRKELRRVTEFVAFSDEYNDVAPTVENYFDVLGRIEREVFGRWRCWGPREVVIRVGEPLDLRERYSEYQAAPDEASEAATLELERRVRHLLRETEQLMSPMPD